jgi:class 3 adenylate cyclase
MSLIPEIQGLVNDTRFFDYSHTQAVQSTYVDNLDPSKKVQELPEKPEDSYLVTFSGKEISVVVGIVDMVDSTKICAKLGPAKASTYYQVFINSMSKILSQYGGVVIKNIGDCLLYYFPYGKKIEEGYYENCINASNALLESHDIICDHLHSIGLPCLNYRVSLDYGNVIMMDANLSSICDMIGTPVNMCSKINRSAKENEMVVGGDLYEILKKKKQFKFKTAKGCGVGFTYSYPVYSVTKVESAEII